MMGPSPVKPMAVVVGGLVVLLIAVEVGIVPDVSPQPDTPPDEEMHVTCYKWADNGTAQVDCPDKVYAPDSVVNITVEHCDDYEVQIDETPPCERGHS